MLKLHLDCPFLEYNTIVLTHKLIFRQTRPQYIVDILVTYTIYSFILL